MAEYTMNVKLDEKSKSLLEKLTETINGVVAQHKFSLEHFCTKLEKAMSEIGFETEHDPIPGVRCAEPEKQTPPEPAAAVGTCKGAALRWRLEPVLAYGPNDDSVVIDQLLTLDGAPEHVWHFKSNRTAHHAVQIAGVAFDLGCQAGRQESEKRIAAQARALELAKQDMEKCHKETARLLEQIAGHSKTIAEFKATSPVIGVLRTHDKPLIGVWGPKRAKADRACLGVFNDRENAERYLAEFAPNQDSLIREIPVSTSECDSPCPTPSTGAIR